MVAHTDAPLPQLLHALAVIRMNERSPPLIQRFIWRRSGIGVPALVEIIHPTIRPRSPDELRNGFGQRGVATLAFAQLVLEAFAVGDVFSDAHDVAEIARLVTHREPAVMHPDHR